MAGSSIALTFDGAIEKLVEMGFEKSSALMAVDRVGPSLDAAVDYLLNGGNRKSGGASSSSRSFTSSAKVLGKRAAVTSSGLGPKRQSTILDHFDSAGGSKRSRVNKDLVQAEPHSRIEVSCSGAFDNYQKENTEEHLPVLCSREVVDVGGDWEGRANIILRKHFGYQSLKSFRKEALAAWVANQDCLILAATGSDKLCS